MGVLWPLEPATAAKHRLYKHYLDAWWPVLLQQRQDGFRRPRVTFLDAFAGPGRYEAGEDGSPVFALKRLLEHQAVSRMALSRDRVCMVFTEKDRKAFEHLRAELVRCFGPLEKLPVQVEVLNRDARDSAELLTKLGAWGHPILAIFDSWGNVGVPLQLVARIARNPASEVITTFGPNWFSRRNEQDPEQLDVVFGGREYWSKADRETQPEERWRVWLATYRAALQRAGFPFNLQFQVVPHTGQPLYLVFGTGHIKGVQVMKDAMWKVDKSDGLRFRDPRTRGAAPVGQGSLWELPSAVDPELLELVRQRLQQGPTTVEAVGEWLLRETAQWQAAHASKALKFLRDEQQVASEPPGRLVKASRVRLVS